MAKKAKKKNYINNPDMLEEIIKSKKQGAMTDKFSRMIMLLVKRYSSQGKYSGYTYVEDMEGYALLIVCKVWNSFDPEKYSNPFAYFTQTIKRAFWQYLALEERHRDIRDAMLVKEGELPSHSFNEKYYQEMITEAYNESVAEEKMSDRFRNLLQRHIEMLIEDDIARSSILDEIEDEFMDYEVDKKTNMYELFNKKISEKSEDHDPTYTKTLSDDYEYKDVEEEES